MQKLYDKDECAPDALSAKEWLQENGITIEMILCEIEDFDDTYSNLCVTSDLRFLKLTFSCGVYETIEELTYLESLNFMQKFLESGNKIKWEK